MDRLALRAIRDQGPTHRQVEITIKLNDRAGLNAESHTRGNTDIAGNMVGFVIGPGLIDGDCTGFITARICIDYEIQCFCITICIRDDQLKRDRVVIARQRDHAECIGADIGFTAGSRNIAVAGIGVEDRHTGIRAAEFAGHTRRIPPVVAQGHIQLGGCPR